MDGYFERFMAALIAVLTGCFVPMMVEHGLLTRAGSVVLTVFLLGFALWLVLSADADRYDPDELADVVERELNDHLEEA